MSIIVIAQHTVLDPEKLAEYGEKAGPTLGAVGAKPLAVDDNPVVIEGEVEHKRTVILEFESREAFDTWYNSPEYQAIIGLRHEAAPGSMILVKGFEG